MIVRDAGRTRAMHAALHGDFISAIHYNLFLIAGIGYAMLAAVATWLPLSVSASVYAALSLAKPLDGSTSRFF